MAHGLPSEGGGLASCEGVASGGASPAAGSDLPTPTQIGRSGEQELDEDQQQDAARPPDNAEAQGGSTAPPDAQGDSDAAQDRPRVSSRIFGDRTSSASQQSASQSPPLTREDLLERGMSQREADATIVRQYEQEIVDQHFAAFVIIFSITFFLVAMVTFGLQIWVVAAYAQADHRECDVPLQTWVAVLFGLWSLRLCRSCIDRCVCCWMPENQDQTPPLRIRLKDYLVFLFDFVWAVCLGCYWVLQDGQGDATPCKETAPELFMAGKVYVFFHVASTIWLWISIIGLRNMLRTLMRRGYLSTNNGAPPEAIEKNTEVVTLTEQELAENPSCPICIDDYTEDGEPIAKVKMCGHFFHKQCLENWLKTARSCPLCREDLAKGL